MNSYSKKLILACAAATLGWAGAAHGQSQNCTWIAGDGDWDVAANWDCRVVPGMDDNATIDTAGVTVTVVETTTVDTLTLADATLNVQDQLNVSAFYFETGTLGGGGLIRADNLIMDGSSRTLGENTILMLLAQGQWISGPIGINNSVEIIVNHGAELELSSDEGFTGNPAIAFPAFLVIQQGGTFHRTGSGTSLFNAMRVVNRGTFIVGNTTPEDPGPSLAFQSQNGVSHSGRFEVLDDGLLHFQQRSFHTEDAELVGTGVVAFSGSASHTFEGNGFNFDGLTQPLVGGTIVFQNGANGSTGSLYIENAVTIRGQTGTPPQGMNPTFTVNNSFVTEGNQVRFQNNLHIHALDGFDISTALLQLETNSVLFNHGVGNLAYSSEFRLGAAGNGANRTTLHNMPGATLNFLSNALIRSGSGVNALGGIIINEGDLFIFADPDSEGLDPLVIYGARVINRGLFRVFNGYVRFSNQFAAYLTDGGQMPVNLHGPYEFFDGASLGGNGTVGGDVVLQGGRLRTAEADADILPLDEPIVANLIMTSVDGTLTMDADSAVVARLFSDEGPGVGHDYYEFRGFPNIDGTLVLSQSESFEGSECATFTILNSTNNDIVGTFHTIDVVDNANITAVVNSHSIDAFLPGGQSDVVGDLNCDEVVNVSDMLILLGAWGTCPPDGDCPADLNGDGTVDVSDLLILLSNWG